METRRVMRGRLIDHIGLVVRDIEASRRFYAAIFGALEMPLAGNTENDFWADEFFVSSAGSDQVAGALTGRIHLAFQARDPAMVEAFYRAGLSAGGRDNGPPARARITPAVSRPSSSTPTATISKPFIAARQAAARRRSPSISRLRAGFGAGPPRALLRWRWRSRARRGCSR